MMNDARTYRQLLVRLVESYNRDLLLAIAVHYNISAERLLERYHTPYYYMPIVEEATRTTDATTTSTTTP